LSWLQHIFAMASFNSSAPSCAWAYIFFGAPVIVLQFLELGRQRCIHASELAAQVLERRRTDAVLAAQLRHWTGMPAPACLATARIGYR
jgi:hypothetical protein